MTGPADNAEVRRTNMALVMRALAALSPCSRTDIRAATGLVSGTVSSIVDDLVARGLVVETGETASSGGRGRPRRVLLLDPSRVAVAIVQLTAQEIVAEVRDLAGEPVWHERRAHAIRSGEPGDVVGTIAEAINAARAAAASLPSAWEAAIVVAVPAPVVAGATIGSAIEFGIGRTELREALTARLDRPGDPIIMNDGRLGALAEHGDRDPEAPPHAMAYLKGDSGIGGGLVVDGELYLGSHLMAGECGHICVDLAGPACECGARGCLTQYLGLDAIVRAAGLTGFASDSDRESVLEALVGRLEEHDARAEAALETAASALAAAIGTMSNYTDLDLVVLGGFLPRLEPWLRPAVERLIETRARHIPEFNPRVENALHSDDASRIGAWMLGRQAVLRAPDEVPVLDVSARP
ncbi:ROK family protein [Demequina sp. SYSU T00192]|uniref:ROK family protein n=1 Tax=Demequina litoralis TaxID=3051660 RepID=A0ABT8G7P0_9MICO|nr:ROK family protein [Demequina sp. SYSU T00192]MDN4474694.1 ROK family protein [Demequina sp. SYSU T00192]